MRPSLWILPAAALWAAGSPAVAVEDGVDRLPRPKVLMVGIDGCRPDALEAAEAPNLHALIRGGAYSNRAQTGPITVSGPGWSSLLTGVRDGKHGVRDNSFRGENYGEFPHLFVRLKESRPGLDCVSIARWAPIHERIVEGADLSTAPESDEAVAEEAVRVLADREVDVLFLHFDDVDRAGHTEGFDPENPAYLEAIAVVDRQVGRVLEAMRSRETFDREGWLVLVSTDHGGTGTSHGRDIPEHRTIFLIVHGPPAAPGRIEGPVEIIDIPPTAAAHLGIPIDPSWDWDGKPVGLRAVSATSP